MIILYIIFGLIFGSFVSALTWRLHEQASPKKSRGLESKADSPNLSIVNGRSLCPNCHHKLAAIDLIPVFSWLMLGGKCRYCNKAIPIEYPLLELTTALLFALSYIYWPIAITGLGLFEFIVWLVLLVIFIALSVYDIKWYILPDKLVYPATVTAIAETVTICIWKSSFTPFLGAIWGALVIGGLFYLIFQLSGGKWIGGGDVKLGFVLGVIVGGPSLSIMVLFMSSILGLLVSLPVLAINKSKLNTLVPFGPFLIAATFIVVLFGSSILEHFKNIYL